MRQRAGLSHHHLRTLTLRCDAADGVDRLTQPAQRGGAGLGLIGGDHHDHADAGVEGAVHFHVVYAVSPTGVMAPVSAD